MLNKTNRIHLKKQYDVIFRKGKKYVLPHLIIYILTNELGWNRYGIIASKKVGKAPIRNLAKRRMRHVVRITLPQTKTGYDFVIVCRNSICTASFQSLYQEFNGVLKKDGLYVKNVGD